MLDVGSIKKLEDRNKTVLVRFDLNVPLDEVSGKVNDRLTRIKNTINQLKELNSKIVILSHLKALYIEFWCNFFTIFCLPQIKPD